MGSNQIDLRHPAPIGCIWKPEKAGAQVIATAEGWAITARGFRLHRETRTGRNAGKTKPALPIVGPSTGHVIDMTGTPPDSALIEGVCTLMHSERGTSLWSSLASGFSVIEAAEALIQAEQQAGGNESLLDDARFLLQQSVLEGMESDPDASAAFLRGCAFGAVLERAHLARLHEQASLAGQSREGAHRLRRSKKANAEPALRTELRAVWKNYCRQFGISADYDAFFEFLKAAGEVRGVACEWNYELAAYRLHHISEPQRKYVGSTVVNWIRAYKRGGLGKAPAFRRAGMIQNEDGTLHVEGLDEMLANEWFREAANH